MHTTQLAHGKITNADELTIELLEPPGRPAAIRITWPTKASITTPAQFDSVVATTMRLLSAAVIELAALRVGKRLQEQRTLPAVHISLRMAGLEAQIRAQ